MITIDITLLIHIINCGVSVPEAPGRNGQVKSPHVYKMGGETYEMRTHKRLIDITNATPKTIDSLQNLSLPAGVDAEIRM